jgi:hypothetical protein
VIGRRPWRAGSARLVLRLALLTAVAMARPAALADGTLPYAPALARCYDAVLDARFDDARVAIDQACGPAPAQACELMRANAVWWRIQLDPGDRSLDASFQSAIDAVIDRVTRWTSDEPRRADAWFFLGAAYGLRIQFRALRGERLSAALDGKRVKDALEKALALDPGLQDAYFGIGLYHYYAAIAPTALRLLRWMLFLPGGDRAKGLQEMRRARDKGELLVGEADYQLHLIDLWYEQDAGDALTLLEGLRVRYPHNPLFLQAIAQAQAIYLHDHPASLETWQSMLTLATKRQLALPEASEVRARLGMGAELDATGETDRAIDEYRRVADARPSAPHGAAARAQLGLATACDRMGLREQALAAYRAAADAAPADDPDGVRAAARERTRRAPDARAAEAYRLSLEGWRALQRGDLDQATVKLERARTLGPGNPATALRLASLLAARGRDGDALAAYERVAAMQPAPPPIVLAPACLEAGRLLEAAGNRERAVEMYRRAFLMRGAAADTRRAAGQSLERLRAPLPPR